MKTRPTGKFDPETGKQWHELILPPNHFCGGLVLLYDEDEPESQVISVLAADAPVSTEFSDCGTPNPKAGPPVL